MIAFSGRLGFSAPCFIPFPAPSRHTREPGETGAAEPEMPAWREHGVMQGDVE